MKILILILMFFMLSALLIISNNNFFINDNKNLDLFFNSYLEWLDQTYSNSQIIVGDIIKMSWVPE